MRILPIKHTGRSFDHNSNYANRKVNVLKDGHMQSKHVHKYTGVASTDLAYASMFDSNIARDLKLMGLI